MKKNQSGFIIPLAILVVAVIAIGGGTYAYKKAKAPNRGAEVRSQASSSADVRMDGLVRASTSLDGPGASVHSNANLSVNSKKSFKELLALGTPQKCTFAETVANSSTTGTVYVSGGKIRGDFTSVTKSTTVKSHMISDGQTVHAWVDGMSSGFKMTLSAGAKAQSPEMDINRPIDVACTSWTPDVSLFALPTSIKFNVIAVPKINY